MIARFFGLDPVRVVALLIVLFTALAAVGLIGYRSWFGADTGQPQFNFTMFMQNEGLRYPPAIRFRHIDRVRGEAAFDVELMTDRPQRADLVVQASDLHCSLQARTAADEVHDLPLSPFKELGLEGVRFQPFRTNAGKPTVLHCRVPGFAFAENDTDRTAIVSRMSYIVYGSSLLSVLLEPALEVAKNPSPHCSGKRAQPGHDCIGTAWLPQPDRIVVDFSALDDAVRPEARGGDAVGWRDEIPTGYRERSLTSLRAVALTREQPDAEVRWSAEREKALHDARVLIIGTILSLAAAMLGAIVTEVVLPLMSSRAAEKGGGLPPP
jgi:hypothetical protein